MSDFWEKIWSDEDPKRIKDYIDGFDMAEDRIIGHLLQSKAKTVCDAGCGCGVYTLKLLRFGFDVRGFDVSERAVRIAKEILNEHGFFKTDIDRASVTDTCYESGRFDAAVSVDVLDHIRYEDAKAAVKELCRIVKPGGCVILTLDKTDEDYENDPHEITPGGDYIFTVGKRKGAVFHPYTPREIRTLSENIENIKEDERGYTVYIKN